MTVINATERFYTKRLNDNSGKVNRIKSMRIADAILKKEHERKPWVAEKHTDEFGGDAA